MSSFEEMRRLVEVSLFTDPKEFAGADYKDTSIHQLMMNGLVDPKTLRESEVRARLLSQKNPGLTFISLKSSGKSSIFLAYSYDGRPLELEKSLV